MHDTQDYIIIAGVIFFLMYLAFGIGRNVEANPSSKGPKK